MGLFRRHKESDDLEKLKMCAGILADKAVKYFNEDEWEKINLIEFYMFWAAFSAACYILMKDNFSKTVLTEFGGSILDTMTEKLLIERNPNASEEKVNKFYQSAADVYSKRVTEYIDLLAIEMKKPKGISSLVDLTSGILSHLFGKDKNKRDTYDPLFATMIAEHMSAFRTLINKGN